MLPVLNLIVTSEKSSTFLSLFLNKKTLPKKEKFKRRLIEKVLAAITAQPLQVPIKMGNIIFSELFGV